MCTSTTTPEAKAREGIDAQLQAACWLIQDSGQRTSSAGVTLCESSSDTCSNDYILEAELDRQITRSNRLRQSTLATPFNGRL